MRGINDDVRSIAAELEAGGDGFQAARAAARLVALYVQDGVCDAAGKPKPKVRTLMRWGALVAFKRYRTERDTKPRRRAPAAVRAGGEQLDFAAVWDERLRHDLNMT